MSTKARRRIGIFGGSFDPVHGAHLALARAAFDQLAIDEMRWVPAGQPWQKTRPMTPAADREAMVRLAIAGEPGFVLSRIELEHEGPSYTADTVERLAAAEPGVDWFLVIGQDQYAGFHTWERWDELVARVTLAVAARPGAGPTADPAVLQAPHVVVALPPQDVSSTAIRERRAAGLAIDDLVPRPVARYIESHRLYLPPPPQGDPPVGS